LEDLIGYLEARRPSLADDAARQRAGLWIASNRVEKFNDWSVSTRYKHRGMEWTEAGVVSLAVPEAARRSDEPPTLEGQAQLTCLEGPGGPQESRLSDSRRRTDWRPAGKISMGYPDRVPDRFALPSSRPSSILRPVTALWP
jgi:hypothetical protein